MAKKQKSFAEKASSKGGKDLVYVKYVKSVPSEKEGYWRFNESMVAMEKGSSLDAALKEMEDAANLVDIELPTAERKQHPLRKNLLRKHPHKKNLLKHPLRKNLPRKHPHKRQLKHPLRKNLLRKHPHKRQLKHPLRKNLPRKHPLRKNLPRKHPHKKIVKINLRSLLNNYFIFFGEVAEWFKALAWNASWVHALAGSNPVLSAKCVIVSSKFMNIFTFTRFKEYEKN